MKNLVTTSSKKNIISFLKNERSYNLEKNILKSEVLVINRLLDNEFLAIDFYEEICEKLSDHQWKALVSQVLSLAAFWDPESINELKNVKKELQYINVEIGLAAEKLSILIKQREELSEKGFNSYDCYHIVELMDRAASNNYLYEWYVQKKLIPLRSQFSLKYWPEIGDIIQELANDANNTSVEAIDSITIAATSSVKSSITDFFRVLYEGLDEMKHSNYGDLPNNFCLSDKATASMVNSILPLREEDMVESSYVKRARQRLREQSK